MHKKLLHLLLMALFATTGITLQAGQTKSSDISNVDVSDDFFAKLERINRQHPLQQQLSQAEKRKLEQQMAADEREWAKRREAKKAREEAEYQQNKKNGGQKAPDKKPAWDSQTKKPDPRNQPEPRNSYNPHRGHSENNNYVPGDYRNYRRVEPEPYITYTPLSDAELAALRTSHKKNARKQKRDPKVVYDKIDVLRNDTAAQLDTALENDNPHLAQRYENRLNAIEKTIQDGGKEYDYSKLVKTPKFTDPYATLFNNCHGTAIDQQIHEEVCETRSTALEIQSEMPGNFYIDAMVPTVNKLTAQAKIEESCQKAFTFSDAADNLLRVVANGAVFLNDKILELTRPFAEAAIKLENAENNARRNVINTMMTPSHYSDLAYGVAAIPCGVASLVKTALTPANWKSAAEYAIQQLDRAEAMDDPTTKANLDKIHSMLKASKQDEARQQEMTDHIVKTIAEFRATPWDQKVEKAIEFGTMYHLDGLLLGAAGDIVSKAGNAAKANALAKTKEVLKTTLKAFSTEEVIVEASMADMAIVAKVAAEEGIEAASKLAETARNNPGILTQAIQGMEQSPAVLAKEGKAVAKAINEAATEIERATGTIWDHVKPTGVYWPDTKIPKSMELAADNKKFWLAPSATKHLREYTLGEKLTSIGHGPKFKYNTNVSHSAGLRGQEVLHSLQGAVKEVAKVKIIPPDIKIVLPHIPEWELMFDTKGKSGPLPVLYHAVYRPSGHKPTDIGKELFNQLKH